MPQKRWTFFFYRYNKNRVFIHNAPILKKTTLKNYNFAKIVEIAALTLRQNFTNEEVVMSKKPSKILTLALATLAFLFALSSGIYFLSRNPSSSASAATTTYNLYISANGGTWPSTMPDGWTASGSYYYKKLESGTAYGELPTPTRTGYSFTGWYTVNVGGTKVTSATTMGTGTKWIYAHWAANYYTLTADCNSGIAAPSLLPSGWTANGIMPYKSVKYGTAYGELPEPVRQGYIFIGWYTEPSGGSSVFFGNEMGAEDVTIYAQWVKSWTYYMTQTDLVIDTDGYYKIGSAADLARLAYLVNHNIDDGDWATYSYKQTADIDLDGNYWHPIGSALYQFQGTFDGNGYNIYNMNMSYGMYSGNCYLLGLFGCVYDAYICNISSFDIFLEDVLYTYNANAAGIVVELTGDTEISNCRVSGLINLEFGFIGGIVSNINEDIGWCWAIISLCENHININAETCQVGGIVGYVSEGDVFIMECINYGKFTIISDDSDVAGILGRFENNSGDLYVDNCVNAGEIDSESSVGGIVGWAANSCYIDGCINIGMIRSNSYVSGIGYSIWNGWISNCVNIGAYYLKYSDYACHYGGITYYSKYVEITSCYVNCTIDTSEAGDDIEIGAIVGRLGYSSTCEITNCGANITLTSAVENVGAFCYYVNSDATLTVEDSYSLINNGGTQINSISSEHSGMDGNFSMMSIIHGGLPVPIELYHIGVYGTKTGIAEYLINNKNCVEV